jgi:hypothetical protein
VHYFWPLFHDGHVESVGLVKLKIPLATRNRQTIGTLGSSQMWPIG